MKEEPGVKDKHKTCACPYCEGELGEQADFCQSCQIELVDCPECGEPVNKNAQECIHCGATKIRV